MKATSVSVSLEIGVGATGFGLDDTSLSCNFGLILFTNPVLISLEASKSQEKTMIRR